MRPSYYDFVKAHAQQGPIHRAVLDFLDGRSNGQSRQNDNLYSIDYDSGAKPATHSTIVSNEQLTLDVSLAIAESDSKSALRRVVVIEDISPQTMMHLGALLDISPVFFATYLATTFADVELAPPPPLLTLPPADFASTDLLHLHYQRVVNLSLHPLGTGWPYTFKTSGNVPRSVRCLAPLSGRRTGLVRSCCSILRKRLSDTSWVCLVLVDATLKDFVVPMSSTSGDSVLNYARIPQIPIDVSFEHSQDAESYLEFCARDGALQRRSRKSMAEKMIHFFHQTQPDFDALNPSILALSYHALNVVASEWRLYSILMSRYLKFYEFHARSTDDQSLALAIEDLQRWRRRSKQSLHKIHLTELFLAHHLKQVEPSGREKDDVSLNTMDIHSKSMGLRHDYRYISQQIEDCGRSLELTVPVAAMMMQMADTQRSIAETVSVRYLTYIAMVFVPLNFVSSLLSMSNGFLPGQDSFWIYFAVALPLLLVVLSLSLVPRLRFWTRLRGMYIRIRTWHSNNS